MWSRGIVNTGGKWGDYIWCDLLALHPLFTPHQWCKIQIWHEWHLTLHHPTIFKARGNNRWWSGASAKDGGWVAGGEGVRFEGLGLHCVPSPWEMSDADVSVMNLRPLSSLNPGDNHLSWSPTPGLLSQPPAHCSEIKHRTLTLHWTYRDTQKP